MRNSPVDTTPLISIIIATFNAAATLAACFDSVLVQEGKYELIVIDGGSTDGTVQLIEQYGNSISFWSSEPDHGIYDAMNKGIRQARGQWLYFFGADDQLMPDVLQKIQPLLKDVTQELVCGDVRYDTGKVFRSYVGLKTSLQNTVHHQAAFYNRRLFASFRYDDSFKIMSDYELNLIIYRNRLSTIRVPMVIAQCGSGGKSFDVPLSLDETNKIRRKHTTAFTNRLLNLLLTIKYRLHYGLLRKI